MHRPSRSAAILTALLGVVFVFDFASADCPFGPPIGDDSDVPCGITLVGMTGGVPDVRGEFRVVVRDLAMNPMAGCEVSIDFQRCFDIQVGLDQPWPSTSRPMIRTARAA